MKTLLLAIIALVSTGCHTSYELAPRRYQVTHDFSDAQFSVIQREVDHLCELSDDCIYVSRAEHWNKITVGVADDQCNGDGGCFVIFSDESREISITPKAIERGELSATFRHEMGHAAGCIGPDEGNLFEEGNVMYSYVHDIDWTQADLDCIARGLP